MREYDVDATDPGVIARITKSATTPRPIAWVSTTSPAGTDNLAPFSFYNLLSSGNDGANPVLLFSASLRGGDRLKDSARNALETEEFVVNVVTEPLAKQMDETAFAIPSSESEFDHAGLERAASTRVRPPRVADAVIAMECTLYDSRRVHSAQVIFGEVIHLHVSETVLTDGKIDMRKVETVGRLGGSYYTRLDFLEWTRQTDPFSS